jgi:hypothetical protein
MNRIACLVVISLITLQALAQTAATGRRVLGRRSRQTRRQWPSIHA